MYLYILASTIAIYFLLSYIDEKRNLKLHKSPTSNSMKMLFGFFGLIISVILFQVFDIHKMIGGGENSDVITTGNENLHLKNIQADVEVGLPKF